MKFFRVGLSDSSWPSPEKAAQFLKIVNDPANQPVFIHCHGGKHRAGAMTAIYRMSHDRWNVDRAYAEMKQYGFESGFGHGALDVCHTVLGAESRRALRRRALPQ